MELRDKQLEILEIAKVFDEICTNNNIWYSLAFGSVLGAVRHGGFIPWDPDMDVFVKKSELEKLREALKRELPEEYELKVWEEDLSFSDGHDVIYKKGISLFELRFDIFTLVGLSNNERRRKSESKRNSLLYLFFRCKHKDISYSRARNVLVSKVLKVVASIFSDKAIAEHYHQVENRYDFDESLYVGWHAAVTPIKREYILDSQRVVFENSEFPIPKMAHEYLTATYGDYQTPKVY